MKSLSLNQQIYFKKIETQDAYVILAVLIERRGDEIIYSTPKVVRVIPKKVAYFKTNTGVGFIRHSAKGKIFSFLALSANSSDILAGKVHTSIKSPYFKNLVFTYPFIVATYGARPPTF